jgi:uncharacterized protein
MENNPTSSALTAENFINNDVAPEDVAIQKPAPVAKENRIQTIDMVRGFALCGILLMNIIGFGTDNGTLFKVANGPHNNADFITLGAIITFFDGTMRGLFSMLFGAGMILFLSGKQERPTGPRVADYYYRRLLWLVLFGVFNAFVLLWPGDILYYYGLTGMILYPFRKSGPKLLIMLGLLCFLINAGKSLWGWNENKVKRVAYLEAIAAEKAKQKLTPEQEAAKAEWPEIEKNYTFDPYYSQVNVEKTRGSYPTVFEHFMDRNVGGEIWWMYHGIWDFLGMMLLGMALLGLGFFSNKLSTSTYVMVLLVGYIVGTTIGYVSFKGTLESWTHPVRYIDSYRVPHQLLYDLRRLFISIGHAAFIMLVYRSKVVPWLMKGLANVGQMAFTNYLMQSIICTLFFYGYGLGYFDKLRFYQTYYVVFAIWIFQLIVSSIWLRYFRFGPFEWLWRSLTYGKPQPMRIRT